MMTEPLAASLRAFCRAQASVQCSGGQFSLGGLRAFQAFRSTSKCRASRSAWAVCEAHIFRVSMS